MQITCYGKILSRTMRKTQKGDLYSLVLEEPGVYPSVYQFSTRDASLFGQKDGPFGVGKFVTVSGFANGRKKDVEYVKDGEKKSFTKYEIYMTLTRIEPAEGPGAWAAPSAGSPDVVAEDAPF